MRRKILLLIGLLVALLAVGRSIAGVINARPGLPESARIGAITK